MYISDELLQPYRYQLNSLVKICTNSETHLTLFVLLQYNQNLHLITDNFCEKIIVKINVIHQVMHIVCYMLYSSLRHIIINGILKISLEDV